MTPSHGEDGSRTPGRANAWDPTVTNTPSANREYDDYSFDDTTPSPNYNPGTPGGGSGTGSGYTVPHESPNTYTPQTPQSGKANEMTQPSLQASTYPRIQVFEVIFKCNKTMYTSHLFKRFSVLLLQSTTHKMATLRRRLEELAAGTRPPRVPTPTSRPPLRPGRVAARSPTSRHPARDTGPLRPASVTVP